MTTMASTVVVVLAMATASAALSCEAMPEMSCQIRYGPESQDTPTLDKWFAELQSFRHRMRAGLANLPGGDFSAYDNRDIAWTQTKGFIQPQVMVHDRYLYDRERREWTIGKYLDDLKTRYGGIDSVLLWQGYPNIGVDDRNQYDLIRSLPGGLAGVSAMVKQFHDRGVRVFWPYFRWDHGTRHEGESDYIALTKMVVSLDADGINGDTCDGELNRTWWQAGLEAGAGKGLVLEPQSLGGGRNGGDTGWENMTVDISSWAENWPHGAGPDPMAPLVHAYKVIEPRHMAHIVERYAENRTDGVQTAFFNGIGYESWESVWSMFNLITLRDGERIRRASAILREYASLVVPSGAVQPPSLWQWRPFAPGLLHSGAYMSSFTSPDGQSLLYLIVNRVDRDSEGPVVEVPCPRSDHRIFDLYHGGELTGPNGSCDDRDAKLTFLLERLGFGAILVSPHPPSTAFLEEMREMTAARLDSYSADRGFLPQTMTQTPKTPIPREFPPPDTVLCPSTRYRFIAHGNLPQGNRFPLQADVQMPWEPHPMRDHDHELNLDAFAIEKFPVTNQQYLEFLRAASYLPEDTANFLRDWTYRNGRPTGYAAGWDKKPVTWVSREDSEAYCVHHGRRLPETWEWQYAAEGTDGRPYPWGNEDDPSRYPAPSSGRKFPTLDDVDAHPTGRSPFEAEDLVGNVFQWTSRFVDEHSEKTIVRGGTKYCPHHAAKYYFARPKDLHEHNTLITMAPSMDRSGGIGFRCVVDGPVLHHSQVHTLPSPSHTVA